MYELFRFLSNYMALLDKYPLTEILKPRITSRFCPNHFSEMPLYPRFLNPNTIFHAHRLVFPKLHFKTIFAGFQSKLQPIVKQTRQNFGQQLFTKQNRQYRSRFYDDDGGSNLIWGIIGVNALVYLGWVYAENCVKTLHDAGPLKFMAKNFTLGLYSLSIDNLHSIITAHFSHKDLLHFGMNMFVLHSFGMTMVSVLGTRRFMRLYILSGLCSSIVSLANKAAQGSRSPSLGASGCVSGVVTNFALMFPRATISVFIFPVPAWMAVGGLAAFDIYTAWRGRGMVDAAGHIGGGLGGLLYYLIGK